MKYYLILLDGSKVVDVCSYAEEEARDRYMAYLNILGPYNRTPFYTTVQTINIVN